MAYSPTDWADGLTPVDEAHLDKIEQGIVATEALALAAQAGLANKEDKANKGANNGYASLDAGGKVPDAQIPAGIARDTETAAAIAAHEAAADPHTGYQRELERGAANGYAPLDAGSKVPVANLPPIGVDFVYQGGYSAATAYKDGDIVLYNGVLYLNVVPGTNIPPEDWGVNQTIPARLGPAGVSVSDLNLALDDGWYTAEPSTPNSPFPGGTVIGMVCRYPSAGYVAQMFWQIYPSSISQPKFRAQAGGAWNAWT